jgi:photosystem II protein
VVLTAGGGGGACDRLAMLGFAASILGEVLTSKGAMAQFDFETGLPLADTEPLILGLIAFNLFAALGGVLGLTTGSFVPEERITGGDTFDATRSLARPAEFFGIEKGFGFTKENELFVGRVAQLGFASSLIGEAITGLGPLAQFGFETGLPLSDTEPLLLAFIALFATFAINEGTGKFTETDE